MNTVISPTAHPVLPLLRWMLTWYPKPFRKRFEQEMLLTFQDWLNNETGMGSRGRSFRISSTIIADLLLSILKEHCSEWRNTMKVSSIFQKIAIAALTAWLIFWAWTFGKWVLHLPLVDPTRWLLGKDYSSMASSIFGGAMFLIPFLALLTFVIPALKINISSEGGDSTLLFRLHKMGKGQAVVAWACLGITVVLWGTVFTSRMGWW
ncbi:MAG: hypothetical protein D9V45_00580 [Chloroflexi bacterium]|nr:MAG: hypothetical protein D9V45_00580 [Chloroflexota bacterium]